MKLWVLGLVGVLASKFERKWYGPVAYYKEQNITWKMETDTRDYVLLRLENNMEVLVGSNPRYKKSLIALDVKAGFRHDQLSGLSHLCEHLIYNTSFGSHIESNLGMLNAETNYERTTYYFNFASEALNQTLAMFSDMIIQPNFGIERIKKDVSVVDQEFRDIQRDDRERLRQAFRTLGKNDHPYTAYFGGNNLSLTSHGYEKIQSELHALHSTTYSSHRMRMVVVGSAPLSEMVEAIVPLFSKVPERKFEDEPKGKPFETNFFTTLMTASTVSDEITLLIQFSLQSLVKVHKSKPDVYIAYMLCQSSQGSILDILRNRGWAYKIDCGNSGFYSEFTLFDVSLTLTPQGQAKVIEIIELVFQAISLVEKDGIATSYFEEVKQMLKMQWISGMQEDPIDQAQRMADLMQLHYPRNLVLGLDLVLEYHPSVIKDYISQMTPENMRVLLAYKGAETDQKEPLFGTDFILKNITLRSPDTLGISSELLLPPPNKYVMPRAEPHKSDMPIKFQDRFRTPKRIVMDQSGEVWAQTGISLKSIIHLTINKYSPISLEEFAILNLVAEIRFHTLGEIEHHFSMTEYIHWIFPKEDRIEIGVFGFNRNLDHILERLVDAIMKPNITKNEFAMHRDLEIKKHQNLLMVKPIQQAAMKLCYALSIQRWSPEQIINATKAIKYDQTNDYIPSLLRGGPLLLYLHGSFDLEEAQEIYHRTIKQLGASNSSELIFSHYSLPPAFKSHTSFIHKFRVKDKLEMNSGLAFYLHSYNIGTYEYEAYTRMTLYFLKQRFYHKVRFEERLGYEQRVEILEGPCGGGIFITLQGAEDPIHAELSVERILNVFADNLETMDQNEFQSRVKVFSSLAAVRPQQTKAQENWDMLIRGITPIDKDSILKQYYKLIKHEHLMKFIKNYTVSYGMKRRKLSIHAIGYNVATLKYQHQDTFGIPIEDLDKWRTNQPSYPSSHKG